MKKEADASFAESCKFTLTEDSNHRAKRPCGPGVAHSQTLMIKHCIQEDLRKYNLHLDAVGCSLMSELMHYSINHNYDVFSAVSLVISAIEKQLSIDPLDESPGIKRIALIGTIDDIKYKVSEQKMS